MARNQALNEKMKKNRKEQILSSSLKLFATKGLAATKITDIVKATGMAQGLIYHYYPSKEVIFVELVNTGFKRLIAACRTLEKMDLSPKNKIKLAVEHLLQNLTDSSDAAFYHLLINQATVSQAIPEEVKKIIKKQSPVPYKIMSNIIAKGQQEGAIKKFNADDMANVFWTTIKGLALNKAIHGKGYSMPDPAILLRMFS